MGKWHLIGNEGKIGENIRGTVSERRQDPRRPDTAGTRGFLAEAWAYLCVYYLQAATSPPALWAPQASPVPERWTSGRSAADSCSFYEEVSCPGSSNCQTSLPVFRESSCQWSKLFCVPGQGGGRAERDGKAVRPQGAEDRHLDWRSETGQARSRQQGWESGARVGGNP